MNLKEISESAIVAAVHCIYRGKLQFSALDFARAAKEPEKRQSTKLRAILKTNSLSEYGAKHEFSSIGSVRQFQDRVPIVDYAAIEEFVLKVAAGKANVLTSAPVLMMEKTSGSSSANKLIPYTRGLLNEISAAVDPWIADLVLNLPKLKGTRSYWAISPAGRADEKTAGGIPVGFEDDTAYFGVISRLALKALMAVPSTIARIRDIDEWKRITAQKLMGCQDLGLVSVWSPTFLSILLEFIDRNFDMLLDSIPERRRMEIIAAIGVERKFVPEKIWPRLGIVSCWTDASSGRFLPALRKWFPNTPIQGKGLLATEGVVSVPMLRCGGAVAAITGHFLEFVDLETPTSRPLLVNELQVGARYSPLLTTSGGFYRYNLKDVVSCTGHYLGLPVLRFEGKLDATSDLCGEKLTLEFVEGAMAQAISIVGIEARFAMIAPVSEPRNSTVPYYSLFVDTDADFSLVERFARTLESSLSESHHYSYARKLGQLSQLRPVKIRNGLESYQSVLTEEGAMLGSVKPPALDRRTGWSKIFVVVHS